MKEKRRVGRGVTSGLLSFHRERNRVGETKVIERWKKKRDKERKKRREEGASRCNTRYYVLMLL